MATHTFELLIKTRLSASVGLALGFQLFVLGAPAYSQPHVPAWSFEGNQPGANVGFSVCSAGDVNGDGYSDVLVGAPQNDNGSVDEGAAYLFLGSPAGLSLAPDWTTESNQSGAHLGSSVASAGDVNGDGYSDVLVGAPDYDDGQEDEGAVLLYLGSPGGLSSTPARLWQGDQASARFGASVSGAGNVNADGFDDVLIGAPGFDDGETDEGAAFLFLGAASELPAAPAWSAKGNQAGVAFGSSVAALGDMNGDGFGDVVIGAPLYDNGLVDQGQARFFGGIPSGLGASPLNSYQANVAGAHFGASVAGAGDLTGDGIRRILFGAPLYQYTHQEEGGTFFDLGQSVFFLDFGRQDFAHRGVSIASAGDVNADGLGDVVIGADRFDDGEEDEGRGTVHLGHPSFVVDRTPAWVVDGNQSSCAFGSSVASAGDVNGDGFDDVVIGAPQYDRGQVDEGRAFLFLGPSGTTAGVGDNEVSSIQRLHFAIEPNPIATDAEFVFNGNMQALALEIFDSQGRLIDLLHPSGARVRWSPSGSLPRGIYFARVQGRNISETVKFAIIR